MDKKVIAVVYTSMGNLVNNLKKRLTVAFPERRIVNIADDSLIKEVMENGKVTPEVRARMMLYFEAAARWKPEVIISACSSVGEVAEEANGRFGTEIVRIDRGMIEKAVQCGRRIGVLASLETTLLPTTSYLERIAEKEGKSVQITARVAKGAYEANSSGNPELHDKLIMEEAEAIAEGVDMILLAQGSMERMAEPITEATGVTTLSSPALCVEYVKKLLAKRGR